MTMRRGTRAHGFIDLNLLPEEARPQRGRLLLVPILLAALGAAGFLLSQGWELNLAAHAETAQLESRLARYDEQLRVAQVELQIYGRHRAELETLELALADLEESRRELLGQPEHLAITLARLLDRLPPGATVLDVSRGAEDGGRITIVGVAPRIEDVLDYATAIESAGFGGALVTSLADANPEDPAAGVRFSIELAP